MNQLKFGILTVSDRCYEGETIDTSGSKLQEEVWKCFPRIVIIQFLVPDDRTKIENVLIKWSNEGCDVILTTGGTGVGPRDITPEATRNVIEKEVPGLSLAMITKSMEITEMAMLSRAVCGIVKNTLIINLPGSPKGAVENFGFIKNVLPHAMALIKSDKSLIEQVHNTLQQFSPSKVKLDNIAERPRTSQYPMLEVEDACNLIIEECQRALEFEMVPYERAINYVLGENIYAPEPIPPFRASMKDGYAVKSSDVMEIRNVIQYVAAGDTPNERSIESDEAVRISTGAAIPPGADAVVQIEDTSIVETSKDGLTEVKIKVNQLPTPGKDIREIGSDVEKGTLILNEGERITPAHIGVLASLGITKVKTYKKPTVGILSTGNEIKNPRDKLQFGQIRDSNKSCLMHLIKKFGFVVNDCGIAKDDPNEVKSALNDAFTHNDVVVTTGGVSMGEFDVVKRVLVEDFNAIIRFGRVNMKPGKPTTFAALSYKEKPKLFFGLPGNPVSCNVTCILFVIPSLRYMERCKNYKLPVVNVTMPIMINNDERPEYHRVTVYSLNGVLYGKSTGNQISSRLSSMVHANGLALVTPPKKTPQTQLGSSLEQSSGFLFPGGNSRGSRNVFGQSSTTSFGHNNSCSCSGLFGNSGTSSQTVVKTAESYRTILFDDITS